MKSDKSVGHGQDGHKADKKDGPAAAGKARVLSGTLSVSAKGVGYFEPMEVGADGALEDTKDVFASTGKRAMRDKAQDIEIQPERLGGAFHGDDVEIVMTKDAGAGADGSRYPSTRPQGEVVRVISRAKSQFVGTLDQDKGKVFLVPDDRRMYRDILITALSDDAAGKKIAELEKEAGVKMADGIKAVVDVTDWGKSTVDEKAKSATGAPVMKHSNPTGQIMKVLGRKGVNEVEMQAIVYEKGFETGFPAEVEAEAEHIEQTEIPIPAEEIAKRRDFRQTFTSTIDPVDAKDFDDAISFKKLDRKDAGGNDLYEVGVHIADVSHYVREKNAAGHQSALDKEAVKRGCSIYLVDRTVPMLPEVLSNDICSLNPNVDRLTFSAVFDINIKGEIEARWFGKTIIHSHKRFSYETAQASLNADGKTPDKSGVVQPKGEYHDELTTLNTIALALARKKFAAGAIDFEKDEVKFLLDSAGHPIKVYRKERLATHKLVEDFMLLANREVAEYIHRENVAHHRKEGAFIYRIHDLPDPEKLTDLSIFVRALGFDLDADKGHGKIDQLAIRKLLDEVTGTPQEELVKTATIRTMAKAVYSTQNIGHFGLAFKYYTHFTSPIRRYPDLLVHRVLHQYLQGKSVGAHEFARYETMALKSTKREILAAEAERASIKYKQVEYMLDKVGQTFDGTITGVTEWGVYVEEKETKCEGMIKVRDLGAGVGGAGGASGGHSGADFFTLDQKNYCLVGEKTGKRFSLGDPIRFKVLSADMEKKTLDYVLAL